MTATSTEMITTRLPVALPRVNLLPPEMAERITFRRIQCGLAGGLLATIVGVGLVYMAAAGGVSDAQTKLDQSTAKQATLQQQTAKFATVTAVYAQASAANTQLTTAMSDEVRYSQLLSDLSMSVPSNVWLKSVSFTQTPSGAAGASPTGARGVVSGPSVIGTFTVTGVGATHDDVALWLERVANLKTTYSSPTFTNSTEVLLGTAHRAVNFSSTASIISSAESPRYKKTGV